MKNIMTKKTVATLTAIMLAQPSMAVYTVDSNDCYTPSNAKAATINVSKFTHVWQKLHRDSRQESKATHLQKYIETSLENREGTLDVEKFSAVWQTLHHSKTMVGTAHLSQYIDTLLENASKSYACSSVPIVCDASIDVDKFSTLWNEVKVKNNHSAHLTTALTSLVDATTCTSI